MRTVIVSVLSCLLIPAAALAQTTTAAAPLCLQPYPGVDFRVCTPPEGTPPACVRPYPDLVDFWLCPPGVDPQSKPVVAVEYGQRWVITQAQIGKPMRELQYVVPLAYVVLVNPEDTPQTIAVEYVREGQPGSGMREYQLPAKARFTIDLGSEPAVAGWQGNLSITGYFQKAGSIEMAWHEPYPPYAPVTTKVGVLVPRALP